MKTTTRVGRNEPCPCGSGKKYKACCESRVVVAEAEPRSSSWKLVTGIIVGAAVVGAVALQFRHGDAEKKLVGPSILDAAKVSLPGPTDHTPLQMPMPQPPGPVPPGKVWSPEHGHWHDLPSATPASSTMPITVNANGTTSPAVPAALTPQPPGPTPEGKVWSPEHGHWHDIATGMASPQ